MNRFSLSLLFAMLLTAPFVLGQRGVDSVSEAGEKLELSPRIKMVTDGLKRELIDGDQSEALKLYRDAALRDTSYGPAGYSASRLLMRTKPDSAILFARRAYMSDTTNRWYLSNYAQCAINKGEITLAKGLYERLIVLNPRDLNGYRLLAIIYQQNKRPHAAIALLDTAEMRAGRNPYLTALKRQIQLSVNLQDDALAEAKEIVNEAPQVAENRVALAELYNMMRRDSLSQVEYDAAMRIDSTNIETLISYGNFLHNRGNNRGYLEVLRRVMCDNEIGASNKLSLIQEVMQDKALYQQEHILIGVLITEALIYHPNNAELIELLAQHNISSGMIDEALLLFKRHLNDEPATARFYHSVIDIERYKQRPDSAMHYLNEAISKFPDDRDFKYERIYVLTTQKRYDEAISGYKEQLAGVNDSISSSIWGVIGDIQHQKATETNTPPSRRDMRATYKSYDKALEFSPSNTMVLNNYAYFLCEYGGNLDHALELSERSIAEDKSNATFLDTYAWILHKLGRYEEAKVAMRRAFSFDTTANGEIALHYGEILAVLGETTMSEFYWSKAIEGGYTKEQVEASRSRAATLRAEYIKNR